MTQRSDVTRALAEWIVDCDIEAIPVEVQRESVRTFVNWLGCAVGGARHETVDRALAAVTPFSGQATSTVLGRGERLDALHAALLNGIISHVLDYDDSPGGAGGLGPPGRGRDTPGFRERIPQCIDRGCRGGVSHRQFGVSGSL